MAGEQTTLDKTNEIHPTTKRQLTRRPLELTKLTWLAKEIVSNMARKKRECPTIPTRTPR